MKKEACRSFPKRKCIKYTKRTKIANKISSKRLIIPYFRLCILYFINAVSVIANAQNRIQIEERQPNTNSGFF